MKTLATLTATALMTALVAAQPAHAYSYATIQVTCGTGAAAIVMDYSKDNYDATQTHYLPRTVYTAYVHGASTDPNLMLGGGEDPNAVAVVISANVNQRILSRGLSPEIAQQVRICARDAFLYFVQAHQ